MSFLQILHVLVVLNGYEQLGKERALAKTAVRVSLHQPQYFIARHVKQGGRRRGQQRPERVLPRRQVGLNGVLRGPANVDLKGGTIAV